MAALGDSITAGFGSCFALMACARDSRRTGSGTPVDSHHLRIRAGNPASKATPGTSPCHRLPPPRRPGTGRAPRQGVPGTDQLV